MCLPESSTIGCSWPSLQVSSAYKLLLLPLDLLHLECINSMDSRFISGSYQYYSYYLDGFWSNRADSELNIEIV